MKQRLPAVGFSLLEVMITLFLVTILVGLVIPRLGLGQLESMRLTANRFRNVLLWLRDQGSFGSAEYRLRLDPNRGRYFCEVRQGETFVPVDDPLLQPGVLNPTMGRMIWQPDKANLSDLNEVLIRFTPFGPERPIMVQFVDREATAGYTVSYRPEWTEPRVEQGLLAWE